MTPPIGGRYAAGMIELWNGPTDVFSALQRVREHAPQWQAWDSWPHSTRERWQVALGLALPPLPVTSLRLDLDQRLWKGAWIHVAGVESVWLRQRTPRDALSPWFLVPLAPVPVDQRLIYWGAWLDHLARSFQALPPPLARKACPEVDLVGRLSGPAWALLSGRGTAASLLRPEELNESVD